MTEFKREQRYIVLKLTDVKNSLSHFELDLLEKLVELVQQHQEKRKGRLPNYVVVEEDWPEYELVWKLIEDRMEGGITYKSLVNVIENRSSLLHNLQERFDAVCNSLKDQKALGLKLNSIINEKNDLIQQQAKRIKDLQERVDYYGQLEKSLNSTINKQYTVIQNQTNKIKELEQVGPTATRTDFRLPQKIKG